MKARIIATNDIVDVKQAHTGAEYFLDAYNNPYKVGELDFNVKQDTHDFGEQSMMDGMLAFLNDNKSNMADAYYRELRGEVLLALINFCNDHSESMNHDEMVELADWAHDIVQQLKLSENGNKR